MRNKKNLRYSYTNKDARESNFQNKNFNKTNSYRTNFSEAKFINTSMVGAKFKFCAFYGTEFDNCYIKGALFKKANLTNSYFVNCIISSSSFERCKLQGARFENCKILNSGTIKKHVSKNSLINVEFFNLYPPESQFPSDLIRAVQELKKNDFIRRSRVLHRKGGGIDTVSLKMLIDTFGESFLIDNLNKLPSIISNNFYSLSYLVKALQKTPTDGSF